MDDHREPELEPDGLAALRSLVERLGQHEGALSIERGGEQTGERTFTMPWVETHPLAREAMRFLYDHGLIIPFGWADWSEGRELFRSGEPDGFATLDRLTVLKLLTAVARNDRFSEGAWAQIFEDGSAQVLYRRLLELESAAP